MRIFFTQVRMENDSWNDKHLIFCTGRSDDEWQDLWRKLQIKKPRCDDEAVGELLEEFRCYADEKLDGRKSFVDWIRE